MILKEISQTVEHLCLSNLRLKMIAQLARLQLIHQALILFMKSKLYQQLLNSKMRFLQQDNAQLITGLWQIRLNRLEATYSTHQILIT